MIIIGIDPGTIHVGVGVVELKNKQKKIVTAYHIHSKHNDIFERYKEIYKEITKILKKHNPDKVAIEDQYLRSNAQVLSKLSFISGILWIASVINTDADIEIIYPTSWRRLGVGNGAAKKKDVINFVSNAFNLKEGTYNEDAYEAIGIALAIANKQMN